MSVLFPQADRCSVLSGTGRARRGFTLIELLTVIGIIAVLVGIAVGGMSAAKNMRINSRGQAELRMLQTAIEAYKADLGAYPPDNLLTTPGYKRVDPIINPLYYELLGTELVNGEFRCKGMSETLTPIQLEQVFNRRGFRNSSANPSEPPQTYLEPKESAVRRVTINNVPVDLLASPFPWQRSWPGTAPIAGTLVNPWRYVSTVPTNNAGAYDLWTELYVGDEKRVFKNW
jgi:type IV pilus assembly protein PilA